MAVFLGGEVHQADPEVWDALGVFPQEYNGVPHGGLSHKFSPDEGGVMEV